ncbi:hypothetical protein [Vibrio nomapromontoriensis]|uniref:hypothetical protein n=1 Tax=Vibrio nomapromontoriensis TaxID=2910246 RepID=UPI003D0A1BFB
MPWLHLPSVTATQGSVTVNVSGAFDTHSIQVGDGLLIGQFALVEIADIHSQQLTLKAAWPNVTQTHRPAAIIPTAADFQLAANMLREAMTTTHGNYAAMERWWTENADIEFTAYDSSKHKVRSAKKMDSEAKALEQSLSQSVSVLMGELRSGMDNYLLKSEAQVEESRAKNLRKFPASGYVNFGNHRNDNSNYIAINSGLFTELSAKNLLNLGSGVGNSGSAKKGSSDTDCSVIHIAGTVAPIRNMNVVDTGYQASRFIFPEPDDGTVSFDSKTGTIFDYVNEVDPKYGNKPTGTAVEIHNEAASRNFEGLVKNGDFRLGDVNWNRANVTITTSGVTATADSAYIFQGTSLTINTDYLVEIVCTQGSGQVRLDTSGSAFGYFSVGTSKLIISTGGSLTAARAQLLGMVSGTKVTSFSVRPATNQPRIDRKDLSMFEMYDELVTDDEIFPFVIQNVNRNVIAGVPMVLSKRPQSYFWNFDKETADGTAANNKYFCWKWSALTPEQKAKVATYLGDAIYLAVTPDANGNDVVNTRLRNKAIAGAGNGDWETLRSYGSPLAFSGNYLISPQGVRNSTPIHNALYPIYSGVGYSLSITNEVGVFAAQKDRSNPDDTSAYKGRCFAYVNGVLDRLNKGAGHIGVNDKGTRAWNATHAGQHAAWWASSAPKNVTTADAFHDATQDYATRKGYRVDSGYIGRPSFHKAGKFFDAAYASGEGGFIDLRMSAWDSQTYKGDVKEKFKNGKYRGMQKLVKTTVHVPVQYGSHPDATWTAIPASGSISVAKLRVSTAKIMTNTEKVDGYVSNGTNVYRVTNRHPSTGSLSEWSVYLVGDDGYTEKRRTLDFSLTTHFTVTNKLNSSISGDYTEQMVIADPANIPKTEALKDGWVGTWGGNPPFVNNGVIFTRKNLISTSKVTYSTDSGAIWGTATLSATNVTNTATGSISDADEVRVYTYTAFAKQTKPVANGKVYRGEEGVGDVFATDNNNVIYGGLLGETLLGKVLTSNNDQGFGVFGVNKFMLQGGTGVILGSKYAPSHDGIDLSPPQNNSPAVKVLISDKTENRAFNFQFNFNELVWGSPTYITQLGSATSWSAGSYYQVTSGAYKGYYKCEGTFNDSLDGNAQLHRKPDFNLYFNDNLILRNLGSASGFGDDDTIRIISNTGTFNNYNGDTCLYGTHEPTLQIGWTFDNTAEAGEE